MIKLSEIKLTDSFILIAGTAFYITTLIVANLTAGKLFDFFGVAISVGAFGYMACLSTSDIIVEVYGSKIGYRLVFLGTIMNVVALFFTQLAIHLPSMNSQAWLQPHFEAVFASSGSVIIASIIGYPITESFEVYLWTKIKKATGKKYLWLRNSIVALVSQLLDATIFFSLAFFILPAIIYGETLAAFTEWQSVMTGAWLYGLWKGLFLGSLDYPIVKLVVDWIYNNRISDIPSLNKKVDKIKKVGKW